MASTGWVRYKNEMFSLYAHDMTRLKFAFPKELAAREKDFPLLYGVFYHSFTERVGTKEYLASDRRLKYSNGIFRHYPELDRQE